MKSTHFDNALIALRAQQPFRPFTVVLVNGDRYEIDHHDALVVRDGLAVYIAPGGVPVIFDHEGVSQLVGDLNEQSNEE